MSFLHQLQREAAQLQAQRGQQHRSLDAQIAATESACMTIWQFLRELAQSLNVIEPPAMPWSLDGKTPWPPLKQTNFRYDARKRRFHDREVFDYLVVGWDLVPQDAKLPRSTRVSVNFLPELQRVESRLKAGQIVHQRLEERHPQTGGLLALHFDCDMAARASVLFTPDPTTATFAVRLNCVAGMEVVTRQCTAQALDSAALDELARLIVGQGGLFLHP